jgi:hypothetical protein
LAWYSLATHSRCQWYRYREDPVSASPNRLVHAFGPFYLIVLAALSGSARHPNASICFVVAAPAVCIVNVQAGGLLSLPDAGVNSRSGSDDADASVIDID